MSPTENIQANIQAFLADSRKYFALSLNRNQVSSGSRLSMVSPLGQQIPVRSYRKIVQSLLFVAGLGTFAAGPVMADMGCDGKEHHQEVRAKMLEQHHLKLQAALKLTPEQEPAWRNLVASEQPKQMFDRDQRAAWAKLNTPERAEKMLELSKLRQAQMAERVAVLKTFYATLTPEQQKIFEDAHVGMRGDRHSKSRQKPPEKDKGAGKT